MKKIITASFFVLLILLIHTTDAHAAWDASYWNLPDPVSSPTMPLSAPDFTETIGTQDIDINWLGGSPDGSIGNDGFVARFTQTVSFDQGNYVFAVSSDDGVRVKVDGTTVVSSWQDQSGDAVRSSNSIALASGNHDITVEYYDNSGNAHIHFWYDYYPYTGSGTQSDPYIINNCTGLQLLASDRSYGNTFYELGGDIDCSETSTWNSNGAGGYTGFLPIISFNGRIDGAGHTISDLVMNYPSSDYIGIFRYFGGSILNLHLHDNSITGRNTVGSLIAQFQDDANILGISSNSSVSGNSYIGGLVGETNTGNAASIQESSFTGSANGDSYIGGIIGKQMYNGPEINNVYVNATITATSGDAGGIFGYATYSCGGFSVTNSYVAGTIDGSTGSAAGIVARIDSKYCDNNTVTNSFVDATILGSNKAAFVYASNNARIILSGNFFNQTTVDTTTVIGTQSSSTISDDTTAVNTDGATPGYFKENVINSPMSLWDFDTIWQTNAGAFPTLQPVNYDFPSTPLNLSVTGSGLSLDATWDAPTNTHGLAIKKYQIQMKKHSESWSNPALYNNTIQAPYEEITIGDNLTNYGETYDVRVRAYTAYGYGDWTETSYSLESTTEHIISSCEELQAIDQDPDTFADTFVLSQDIDCTGIDFVPLGWGNWSNDFQGVFDGNGKTISNLTIDYPGSWDIGLFSETNSATIKNLTISNSTINSFGAGGAIVGYAYRTTIDTVTVTNSTVSGRYSIGGLIGDAYLGTITNNTSSVALSVDGGDSIGGIIGYSEVDEDNGFFKITGNTFTGSFDINNSYDIGGIVGYLDLYEYDFYEAQLLLTQNQARFDQTNENNSYIGGIIGYLDLYNDDSESTINVTISENLYSGNLSGDGYIGGLIGYIDLSQEEDGATTSMFIENNRSMGTISAGYYTGGLLGYGGFYPSDGSNYDVTIQNSYSSMNITSGEYVGGAMGGIQGLFNIKNIFAVGSITSPDGPNEANLDNFFTGLISFTDEDNGSQIVNNWYDSDLTGMDYCMIRNETTPTNEEGLCQQVTNGFTLWGGSQPPVNAPISSWDFQTIWAMTSEGYPVLQIELPHDTTAPVLTTVTPISSPTTLSNATFYFTTSEACNVQAEAPTSTTGQVTLLVDEAVTGRLIGATLQGMQLGGTYSFNLRCRDTNNNTSNVLYVGPFTIQNPQASGGRTGQPYKQGLSSSTKNNESVQVEKETNICPSEEVLTQDLKSGARNGRYHWYTKGIVKEAKVLQTQLNRLGFSAGPVDGILGTLSDKAIKRMQTYLGTKADGFVGPATRILLNNSCGSTGLKGNTQ